MAKPRTLLKWIVLAVVVIAMAGVIAVYTLDLGFLRNIIEGRLSASLGREVRIDSRSVRLDQDWHIEAGGVRIANADWAGTEPFIELEHLSGLVDPRTLVKGPVSIRDVRLQGLRARLAEDAEGRVNWLLGPPSEESETPAHGLPFLLFGLSAQNASISYTTPRLDEDLRISVASLKQRLADGEQIRFDLEGSVNDRELAVDGWIGPWRNLCPEGTCQPRCRVPSGRRVFAPTPTSSSSGVPIGRPSTRRSRPTPCANWRPCSACVVSATAPCP